MPFISVPGLNPQPIRTTVSGLATLPISSLASGPLSQFVDATAQNLTGLTAWFKDAAGRISVLAYAQAQASIPLGVALIQQSGLATTLNSAAVSTQNGLDTGYVAKSRTADGGLAYNFAGIAAASVNNTGYFFWRYISGFVPFAQCGSAIPSGNPICLSASTAGVMGSLGAQFNATLGTSVFNTVRLGVGHTLSLTDNADGSMASIFLTGWYA